MLEDFGLSFPTFLVLPGVQLFLTIWTLKSAGVPGCHVVLALISKLSVLWSKTHPYSIKVSQNHSHLLEVFIGFLFIFFHLFLLVGG